MRTDRDNPWRRLFWLLPLSAVLSRLSVEAFFLHAGTAQARRGRGGGAAAAAGRASIPAAGEACTAATAFSAAPTRDGTGVRQKRPGCCRAQVMGGNEGTRET